MIAATTSPCGPNTSCADSSAVTRNDVHARFDGRSVASGVHDSPTGSTVNRRHGQRIPVQSVGVTDTEKYQEASVRLSGGNVAVAVTACVSTVPSRRAAA
jgi:hypothetical protein